MKVIPYCLLIVLNFWGYTLKAGINNHETEVKRWKEMATKVTVIRDQWDVPHIFGKTDADVVFGLMYAQCEDDFDRIERNYLEVMGRMAEAFGEKYVFEDLRQRLFIDTLIAKELYTKSPFWLKQLMDAWADGMNYYLYVHPERKPRLIKRFQPWMPVMFSEGSIGGDITSIPIGRLKAFYGKPDEKKQDEGQIQNPDADQRGSNGIAVGPRKSASGNAMLLINPHTTFFFRTEVHMVSEEGLNAYGAVTWGQFFVYQGFNEHCGWMHTSSSTDAIDEYLEIISGNNPYTYQFEGKQKPVSQKNIVLNFIKNGKIAQRSMTVFYTHHGPVTGSQNNNWITTSLMNNPLEALQQSYLRTKATGFKSFEKVMNLRTNSSNNTMFADQDGNIGYWQGNFIPKRKSGVNTASMLDGSDADFDWKGTHELSEIIQFKNPVGGWLQNCNSSPYEASGNVSDLLVKYPAYMGAKRQNYRAVNAIRELKQDTVLSLEGFIELAYNPHLPAFEVLIPSLLEAIKTVAITDSPDHIRLKEAYTLFESWNATWSASSVATSLAIFWGNKLLYFARNHAPAGNSFDDIGWTDYMASRVADSIKTKLLIETMSDLERDFGSWKTPWGEINRFQRVTGAVDEQFDDGKLSFAVPFATAFWGSLATSDAKKYPGTKKQYGTSGNSFVAIVEFGKKLRAFSIVPGGHSSDSSSAHFNNQSELFSNTKLKAVNFYREDIDQVATKTYHPGL
jgi:acyl-homoserine-lactone acylase